MTTGTWDPSSNNNGKVNASISPDLIQRFLALAESDQLADLASQISAEDQSQFVVMKADLTQWKSVLAESDEAEAGEADDKDVPSA